MKKNFVKKLLSETKLAFYNTRFVSGYKKAGKIMRIITLLLLLVMTGLANAEVYKCITPSKQTVYQSTPCTPNSADKNIVNIPKLDAHQIEEAEQRLKATEAERQALDKAEQTRQAAETARWQAEAPQRAAAAAQLEAAAARESAEYARQQATIRTNSYPVFIPYPSSSYGYNNGYSHRQNTTTYRSTGPYIQPNDPMFSPYPITNPSLSPNSTLYPPVSPYNR
jgi:hypothetical protein